VCDFCTLDLPLSESFLVLRDSVDKSKILFLPRVVVMQATLVHLEFNMWFGLRLPAEHTHTPQIIAILCDAVLIYQIAQRNDNGNRSLSGPNSLVVARFSCF
jgi:hypothetical protein